MNESHVTWLDMTSLWVTPFLVIYKRSRVRQPSGWWSGVGWGVLSARIVKIKAGKPPQKSGYSFQVVKRKNHWECFFLRRSNYRELFGGIWDSIDLILHFSLFFIFFICLVIIIIIIIVIVIVVVVIIISATTTTTIIIIFIVVVVIIIIIFYYFIIIIIIIVIIIKNRRSMTRKYSFNLIVEWKLIPEIFWVTNAWLII